VEREPALPRVLRFLEGDLAALRQPGTLLLFQAQAKRLKVKVGDVITISAPTARGVNNTADVKVAAVARDVGLLSSFSAFIEASTLRGLYGLNDTTTGAIHLYLRDEDDAPAVASRLRAAFAETGWRVMEPAAEPYWMKLMFSVPAEDWTGQKIDVTTADEEMDQFKTFVTALNVVSWVLVVILLLVVLVGILNTLAIAVRERTKEIGTLRAIGMQRRKVLWLFVLETAMLSTVGTVAGALLAIGLALAINAAAFVLPPAVQIFLAMEHLRLLVHPGWVAAYVAGISTTTVLASLYPARRAARLRPVTAMHHVG
jgi:ABC-type lipoprotein release transport system permease subunit